MPIITEGPRVRATKFLEDYLSPLSATIAATAEQVALDNPISSISRAAELGSALENNPALEGTPARQAFNPDLQAPQDVSPQIYVAPDQQPSPVVSAEEARARVQREGLDLTIPDAGIPQRALDILIERKRQERLREDTLNRGPSGFVPGSLRLATALGVSLLDPINDASAFIPFVGEGRYAALLARFGGSAFGRAAVRFGVGAIEGGASQALLEPITYGAHLQEQADYTLLNSITNIALGTVLGGGLHVAGGLAADIARARALRRAEAARAAALRPEVAPVPGAEARPPVAAPEAPRPLEAAPAPEAPRGAEAVVREAAPETRAAMLQTAVTQVATGRDVNVEPIAGLDPRAVAAKAQEAASTSAPAQTLAETVQRLEQQTPGLKLDVSQRRDGSIILSRIVVPQDMRSQGIGTAAMRELTAFADRAGATIGLSPSGDFGGTVSRLKSFYRSLGFVENTGPARDLSISESMIRTPQAAERAVRGEAPVSPRAWPDLQAAARQEPVSALADPAIAKEADQVATEARRLDTPDAVEAAAKEAATSAEADVRELATALGREGEVDKLAADSLTEEADTYSRAARAMALCQLRRGA